MGSRSSKKTHFSLAMLVALIAGLVFYVFNKSSEEALKRGVHAQVQSSQSREPASIERVFDFSYLEGEALVAAAKKRVAQSITVESARPGSVDIELGNFVLLNENGQKDFACGFYDRVTLTFEAEGVAVNGERPKLVVQTGCEVGANINSMTPIRIPVDKLRTEKPGNSEYKFFDDRLPLSITSSNPPADWPALWVLSDMKLSHSQNSSRILHLSQEELRVANSKLITMKW